MTSTQRTTDFYNPPFCVIADESFDRMFATLQRGKERYVKSYLHNCPHKDKADCKCIFYLNFLKDGKMVRVMNGEIKDVFRLSDYLILNGMDLKTNLFSNI